MINLLPPDVKQNISYARQNTKLAHWSLALLAGVGGTCIVVLFGLFYINQSLRSYSSQINKTSQGLGVQKLDETQKSVQEISGNLKLVVQVLSREILFSKLIKQIGGAIPPNAILTDLKIAKTTGGIDLTAAASDYGTATQVQINLQDPANKIFDKADLINVTCGGASAANPRYPCTVTIRAQFAKSNPFLFINTTAPKGNN